MRKKTWMLLALLVAFLLGVYWVAPRIWTCATHVDRYPAEPLVESIR